VIVLVVAVVFWVGVSHLLTGPEYRPVSESPFPGIVLYPGATKPEISESPDGILVKFRHGLENATYGGVFHHYDQQFQAAGYAPVILEASMAEKVKGWIPRTYQLVRDGKTMSIVLEVLPFPGARDESVGPESVMILRVTEEANRQGE